MDKSALVDKIKLLEGLTNDEKADLIGLLRSHKKYGLVWEEKLEDVEERLREQLPVLTEVKERAIVSEDADAPNHILIEGDNLEALTALSYSHEGKIDVIYIDPPYNTGESEQFMYNDKYVDAEDDYIHSKWLSFISKRLKLAKSLLTPNGIIFISIDYNEVCQLKILCDEIFNNTSNPKNSNLLGLLVWDLGTGTSAGHFTRSNEFILAYCKNKSLLPNFSGGEGIIDDRALKKESKKNTEFEYTFKKGTKFEAPDGFILEGSFGGTEKVRITKGRMICEKGMLAEDVTLSACWTQRKQMDSYFNGKETFDTKGQKVIEFYFRENGKLYCRKEKNKINPPTVLRDIATTKQGSGMIKQIFEGEEPLKFAKPLNLIKFLIGLKDKNITILDFFGGSATTLHATMELNKEDEGQRTCIIATSNENNICEKVAYIRNKKVINGYITKEGEFMEGLKRNTLRYYKTELLSRDRSPHLMRELMQKATDLLCIKEDLYTEQPMFGKYKTHPKVLRYFAKGEKRMLILYREEFIPEIVEEIKTLDFGKEKLKIYLFSPARYAFDDDFFEVQDKVQLVALPAAIYDAYQKVLPQRKDKLLDISSPEETTIPTDLFSNEEGGAL